MAAVVWNDDMAQRYDFLLPVTVEFSKVALNQLLQRQNVSSEHVPTSDFKILDVACGTGAFAHAAADMLPKSTILGTDYSQDMINIFKAKTESLGLSSRVSGEVLDGQNLNTIAENSFDLVGCVFGLMFFPDQTKGWKEIHRVLKPGGFGAVVTWVEADFINIMMEIFLKLRPGSPNPMFIAALSCADAEATIAKIQEAAHFQHVESTDHKAVLKPSRAGIAGFAKGVATMAFGAAATIDDNQFMAAVDAVLNARGHIDGESGLNFHAVTYIVGK